MCSREPAPMIGSTNLDFALSVFLSDRSPLATQFTMPRATAGGMMIYSFVI
jgi:hypothetical protein